MRRKPADPKYDFCFLITEEHLQKYKKEELINFVLEFMQGIDKEIQDMKLAIITSTRQAATYYSNTIANNVWGIKDLERYTEREVKIKQRSVTMESTRWAWQSKKKAMNKHTYFLTRNHLSKYVFHFFSN